MKKEIAIAMLACLLSLSSSAGATDTTANHTGTVKLSEFSDSKNTVPKNENDFGFMDFYYGEPIEEIQEKYTIEHLWDEEWELRNLAPRGCLGLTKPAYITLRFKDKKLRSMDVYVSGDKRNISQFLIKEYGTPVIHNKVPCKMENYAWKRNQIAIIYQHDDNDEDVLLNFMPADLVAVSYR